MKSLDNFMNHFSMYRLILYFLLVIVGLSFILDFFKIYNYSLVYMVFDGLVLVVSGYLVNLILSNIFDAPLNPESNIITSLILFLIITPVYHNIYSLGFLIVVSIVAQASKYLITYRDNHIFNPAALSVLLVGLLANQPVSWWVGNIYLTPLILVGGVLLVRKVADQKMVYIFIVTNLLLTVLIGFVDHNLLINLKNTLLISPLFFLGFIMLTEPLTSPKVNKYQIIYALIVAVLLLPQIHIGSFYTSPELALIIGNLFAFLVSSRQKLFLFLNDKSIINHQYYEFIFDRPTNFTYLPGQYMEWTLPHDSPDQKGVRRFLTLSSSPSETFLSINVKVQRPISSFKNNLINLKKPLLIASSLGGDFILPKDQRQKIVFLAGGIGITPFRSMIKYLVDLKEPRQICLLYFVHHQDEILYDDIFKQAMTLLGIKIFYIVSSPTQTNYSCNMPSIIKGRLSEDLLSHYLDQDLSESIFYVAGSGSFIKQAKKSLKAIGVRSSKIKTDSFSGY